MLLVGTSTDGINVNDQLIISLIVVVVSPFAIETTSEVRSMKKKSDLIYKLNFYKHIFFFLILERVQK